MQFRPLKRGLDRIAYPGALLGMGGVVAVVQVVVKSVPQERATAEPLSTRQCLSSWKRQPRWSGFRRDECNSATVEHATVPQFLEDTVEVVLAPTGRVQQRNR